MMIRFGAHCILIKKNKEIARMAIPRADNEDNSFDVGTLVFMLSSM
jgi:hypothetical protein